MSRRRGSLIMKLKKTVSAVLAGAMLLGTSAFAKDNIYAYNKFISTVIALRSVIVFAGVICRSRK